MHYNYNYWVFVSNELELQLLYNEEVINYNQL